MSSFGSTIKSSSSAAAAAADTVVDAGLEALVGGEEICVDENLGELEEAGEADWDKGDGRSVIDGIGLRGVSFEGDQKGMHR